MEPSKEDREAAKRVYEALKELNTAVLAAHARGLHVEIEQSRDDDSSGEPVHHSGSVQRRILVYPPSAERKSA